MSLGVVTVPTESGWCSILFPEQQTSSCWLKWLFDPEEKSHARIRHTSQNRFGAMCTHAKTEPVFVEKDGRIDTVILSADHFDALNARGQGKSLKQQKKVFDQTHKA